MRWCDRHEVGCLIGLPHNARLERLAKPWMETAATQFAQTNQKQRLFGEFVYGAETRDRERRVIVKAERLDQGPNPSSNVYVSHYTPKRNTLFAK
jgi:hypothetical protein